MLKKFFYKVHLTLGLTIGLILIVSGLSGSILSFEKEILRFINFNTYTILVPNKEKIPIKNLLKIFKERKINVEISSISFSNIDSLSVYIKGKNKEDKKEILDYYINPYTSKILPKVKGEVFFRTVESMHRRLLLKDFGKQVIGISSISFLILILSGVYLYLPRLKRKLSKRSFFTLKSKGKYSLNKIHSLIGICFMPFYLFAVLTGLNWSYDWYNKTIYKLMDVDKPLRTIIKNLDDQNNYKLDEVSKAIQMFDSIILHKYKYSLVKIPKNGTIYSFLYMDENAKHRRERNKLVLDIKSKEVLKHERFENNTQKKQIMISMLTLHTGEYFGIIGQILMFVVALFLPFFFISGLFLYIKKKKKKDKKYLF